MFFTLIMISLLCKRRLQSTFFCLCQAVHVKSFIDDLCRTGELRGVNYTFRDECFTSKVCALNFEKKYRELVSS